ncbi:rab3 GTPase-activating protein catalytic subunit isoform X1 [Cynara cardunculus var. scolymus]|uniref:rab3 GTPase-activating protein catalytic subunit isoform X1 n=1 Tax=Cynara cardunculus var. scolymus TaxID=59895 RepID=UPI000D62B4F8|nr:rab3 GTPase-activating protein catalytic subunit isoform X1 [Cynara cardunculus var. scolymus]
MAASSTGFVSKARTAFHSAAAKAEKVFTDIKKSDSSTDLEESAKQSSVSDKNDSPSDVIVTKEKNAKWRPEPIKTKQDWQERLKNIRFGKKGVQEADKTDDTTMSFPIFDENMFLPSGSPMPKEPDCGLFGSDESNIDIIPSAAVLRQLAIGVDSTRMVRSMKDLLMSSRDSSPVREKAGLNFSVMKSLVLRDKEDKIDVEFGSLLGAEGHRSGRKTSRMLETNATITSLPKDLHAAPPDSFVVELAEAIGCLKTLRKMASFWSRVVAELRRLWCEGQHIPGIPADEIPDLNCCLLYQQLQVINCCISRKHRRAVATESLDSVLKQASINGETASESSLMYARVSSGQLVLRLGAAKQCENLTLLETGEPVYAPVMQEEPLLTEDLVKETEEFILRTGSVGAGCSQLLSDMQAFKAANPGCILEDFVRWHSPPDWMEPATDDESKESVDGDNSSSRGRLSMRMQKEGNLWREIWETAKPVPAVKQSPLYDEDLSVEGILHGLEDFLPSSFFEQLYISLLCSGFAVAEIRTSTNEYLYKMFLECKDYIVATCQGKSWFEKVNDICQVYETVAMMVLNPDEFIRLTKQQQPDEGSTGGEQKGRFRRLSFVFGKTPPKDPKNHVDENPLRQSFSSMFSKKPPKAGSASSAEKSVQNDWIDV